MRNSAISFFIRFIKGSESVLFSIHTYPLFCQSNISPHNNHYTCDRLYHHDHLTCTFLSLSSNEANANCSAVCSSRKHEFNAFSSVMLVVNICTSALSDIFNSNCSANLFDKNKHANYITFTTLNFEHSSAEQRSVCCLLPRVFFDQQMILFLQFDIQIDNHLWIFTFPSMQFRQLFLLA